MRFLGGFSALLCLVDGQEFVDTPLTTELWTAVSKSGGKTDEDLERLLFSHPGLALARSKDKRGGLWWAWEYKNGFALAALKAYGADPDTVDEDEEGMTPRALCVDNCDQLVAGIDEKVEGILERKEQRKKQDAEDEDDDFDDDLEEAAPKLTTEGDLNIDVDEDEDL